MSGELSSPGFYVLRYSIIGSLFMKTQGVSSFALICQLQSHVEMTTFLLPCWKTLGSRCLNQLDADMCEVDSLIYIACLMMDMVSSVTHLGPNHKV